VEPFILQPKIILNKKKPIVVANPDKSALCAVLETPNSKEYISKPIDKHGFLVQMYKNMECEVFAIGKPFPQIYYSALKHLAAIIDVLFEDIFHKCIVMLGDFRKTSILGIKNAEDDMGF
jgi:ribonucleotide monophosphatase NagD (HAD superfamily)